MGSCLCARVNYVRKDALQGQNMTYKEKVHTKHFKLLSINKLL